MEEQKEGKRPKALAIALIIIVVSMMGNVMLLTQNIGHKQNGAVEDGQRIFGQFAGVREELAYWRQAVAELERRNDESPRLAARYLADLVERGGDDLHGLMERAERLSPEDAGGAVESYAAYLAAVRGGLEAISAGSGPLADAERETLAAMGDSYAKLAAGAEQFPFYAEGDRNTMIRLSGGYEWLHIAAEWQQAMLDFAG